MILRDLQVRLQDDRGSYIQILIGPRQCGKSTLLNYVSGDGFRTVTFDDMQLRSLANSDPALFINQFPPPIIIDEVQYAPNIFPELKRIVDELKLQSLKSSRSLIPNVLIRLTGSDQILLNKKVKESLVGRASYYYLNTLSVHEILRANPSANLYDIMYTGGYPELHINTNISVNQYLNDYIRNYIERDIVLSAGIEKQNEFHTVLGMLAARTGGFINYSSIARDSGVKSVTVAEWVSILQRTDLLYLLPPSENNLNKRLIKMPKIYFLDTGLATRLQGWTDMEPFCKSPQIGPMFETLVLAEIIKFIRNFGRDWKVSVWRTKDGHEIDFVIEAGKDKVIALDAKLGIHNVKPESLPQSFKNAYPQVKQLVLVSMGGHRIQLSKDCYQCPISELTEYLLSF